MHTNDWAEHARRFIVTSEKEHLQRALGLCTDATIASFLDHPDLWANRQIQPSIFERIVEKCISEGREAEGIVVNLLGFRFVALAMQEVETYDHKHQAFIEATCLTLTEQSSAQGFQECEALFLGSLATGESKLRKYHDSYSHFEQALSVAREVVANEGDIFGRLLAGLLHNYGNALRFAGHFASAQKRLTESLSICRRLTDNKGSQLEGQLASTLSDLSAAFQVEGRFNEAEPILREAVAIQQHVISTGSTRKERRSFAGMLSNLTLLYTEQRRFNAARKTCDESLRIRRQLASEDPEADTADLAATLSNLGILLHDLREYASAISILREAVAIRRSLAKDRPEVFGPDLATSLNSLANSLLVTDSSNDIHEAFAAYSEALEIRRRLSDENPQLSEGLVAQTLGNLAALRQSVGQYDMAIAQFLEVAAIFRGLSARRPMEYLPRLAGCLGNIGRTHYLKGDYVSARENWSEAVSIWEALTSMEPEVYEGDLAATLNDLSMVLSEMGMDQEALKAANQAIKFAEKSGDHLHLSKGDVTGAYWIVITDRVHSGRAEDVFDAVTAVRNPSKRIITYRESGSLAMAHQALSNIAHILGSSLRLVIVQQLTGTDVFFGVLSSDAPCTFRYEISKGFASNATALWNLLYQPFTDSEASTSRIQKGEVVRLGEAVWNALPVFLQETFHPKGKHDVLICGDPDSIDFPWEALRFGASETDWLGLYRHLARIPKLETSTLSLLQPMVCGAENPSAAILCPWDIPNQPALEGAREEALEVNNLLQSAGFSIVPDGNLLLGSSANKDSLLQAMAASPVVIHFAGHGDLVNNEEVLVVWDSDSTSKGHAIFDRKCLSEAKANSSRQLLFPSRPVVVLNACWAGRSRAFGGQREDLSSAYLDEGASCVIACPTPVQDDMARMLATLLYVPVMQDSRGLAYTFSRVRSIVEKKFRGTDGWWTWFWMRFNGNPFVRIANLEIEDQLPTGEGIPLWRSKAVDLVRDLIGK